MARAAANGIDIEYAVDGAPDAPPLLLIHGVGAQLVRWPEALVRAFVDRDSASSGSTAATSDCPPAWRRRCPTSPR